MATGDIKINIYQKKFLSQQQMQETFFNYLTKITKDTRKRVYENNSGLYDEVTMTGGAGETFDVSDCAGIDNEGNELVLPTLLGVNANIPFENTTSKVYSVGMKFGLKPYGVEVNQRNAEPEYTSWQEVVGEVETADSVANDTGSDPKKLKIVVNKSLQCSVSQGRTRITHAGRKATVWLNNPKSSVEAVAIIEDEVKWDGIDNYIEVEYDDNQGPFGQTTLTISTIASDYSIWINGLTVVDQAELDLTNEPTYAYIGIVDGNTGSTPVAFDTTGQTIMALAFGQFTLDGGYDGAAGLGSGRKVTLDNGAIELDTGIAGPGDTFNSFLRIANDDRDYDVGLDVINKLHSASVDSNSAAGIVNRDRYDGSVFGVSLSPFPQSGTNAPLTAIPPSITLPTGSGEDYSNLKNGICLIKVYNSPAQAADGTYVVKEVNSNVATLINLDGSSPSPFSTGQCSFEIYLITSTLGGSWKTMDSDSPGGSAINRWQNCIVDNPASNNSTLRLIYPSDTPPSDRSALEINNPWDDRTVAQAYITHDGRCRFNGGFEGVAFPALTNDVNLGESGNEWKNIFSVDYTFSGRAKSSLIPESSSAWTLGSVADPWPEIHATDIQTGTLSVTTVDTNLDPTGGSQYIGSGTPWEGGFFNSINVDQIYPPAGGDNEIGIRGNLLPEVLALNIGSASKKWDTIWVQNLQADNITGGGGSGGVSGVHSGTWDGNLDPDAGSSTKYIGNAGNRWWNIITDAADVAGNLTITGSIATATTISASGVISGGSFSTAGSISGGAVSGSSLSTGGSISGGSMGLTGDLNMNSNDILSVGSISAFSMAGDLDMNVNNINNVNTLEHSGLNDFSINSQTTSIILNAVNFGQGITMNTTNVIINADLSLGSGKNLNMNSNDINGVADLNATNIYSTDLYFTWATPSGGARKQVTWKQKQNINDTDYVLCEL